MILESFQLVFKDPYSSVAATLFNIFKGNFAKDENSKEFQMSKNKSVLTLKFLILQSMRLAFHYCVESFVMGEMEVGSDQEFLVR